MKAKPKKKKSKDKPPPSSPIPPELKKLVPDHPDISFRDVISNAEDTMALQVGNKSSMKELVKSAKGGDDKSFLALVKIHTSACLFDSKVDSKLIIPSISADRDFYEQPWVQKRLREKMEDSWFEKDFWKAVSSRQNDTLFQRTTVAQAEFKKYVVNRRDTWLKKNTTLKDIEEELIKCDLIDENTYEDVDSLRRILNLYGVKRKPGRPKGSKNRTLKSQLNNKLKKQKTQNLNVRSLCFGFYPRSMTL